MNMQTPSAVDQLAILMRENNRPFSSGGEILISREMYARVRREHKARKDAADFEEFQKKQRLDRQRELERDFLRVSDNARFAYSQSAYAVQ